MAQAKCTDDEFIALLREHGPTKTAKILGMAERSVFMRRARLESKLDTQIAVLSHQNATRFESDYPARVPLPVPDGVVLIGSDAHFWPGETSTAFRGFLKFASEMDAKAVIMNGDAFDGARISRHPPIGFQNTPTVKQELDCVSERMSELRAAAPKALAIWTLGNHDLRFENKLALQASDFKDVPGFSLKDHFPEWTLCISAWINDDVVVKHRYRGGMHATRNNTLNAGKNIVTGHLHSLKVTPLDDYNGTRWGVDTGTLADPNGPQFLYSEDNPKDHRQGFIVLTFRDGVLMWPEVARVIRPGEIDFRGEVISL